jgi:hypothetical protein
MLKLPCKNHALNIQIKTAAIEPVIAQKGKITTFSLLSIVVEDSQWIRDSCKIKLQYLLWKFKLPLRAAFNFSLSDLESEESNALLTRRSKSLSVIIIG